LTLLLTLPPPPLWRAPVQVVVGVGDPNPLVAAAGIATLEKAGIEVCLMDGAEQQACYEMNREFMARMAAEAAQASSAKCCQ
jgi:diaminohydroxyphosphoribosylaminopyrimidine deaminase/5-amino-6-(5-phosphoribosylamino)uracil reductase